MSYVDDLIHSRRVSIIESTEGPVSEGLIGDMVASHQKKKAAKNKRSSAIDSAMTIISKSVKSNIGNGIGLDTYGIFRAYNDKDFLNGKSNTWKCYFGPVETNKELNKLSRDIANEVNARINLKKLIESNSKGEQYSFEYYNSIVYNSVKSILGESRFFVNEINRFKKAVKSYVNSENETKLEEDVSAITSKHGFSHVNIKLDTRDDDKLLVVSVTMIED